MYNFSYRHRQCILIYECNQIQFAHLVLCHVPSLRDAPELGVIEHLEPLQELLVEEEADGVQVVVVEEPHHHLQREEEDHQTDVGGHQHQIVQTDAHQAQHGQHGGGSADEEEEDGDVYEAVIEEVEVISVEELRHETGQQENHTENLME